MKKIVFVCVLLILLFTALPVQAMETVTYTGTTTGTNVPTVFHFTTLREGDILAHASFPLSSHGIYQLNILNAAGEYVCRSTLDARWGQVASGDMICDAGTQPAGDYSIEFLSNRKVTFTVEVTAETNP